MFVTVKYGDDQSKIFNMNCKNEVLLHHIKRRCECERDDVVELSDEKGIVKNLRNYPYDYGSLYLKEREVLILLKVDNPADENDSQSDRLVFIPMLTGMEQNKEFNEVLNPKQEKSRPSSSTTIDDDARSKKGKGSAPSNKKKSGDKRPVSKGRKS